jgi:hypothetical protein
VNVRIHLQRVVFACVCLSFVFWRLEAQERTNVFAGSMQAFQQRVEAYMDLRGKVAQSLPRVQETSDPSKISAREKNLGAAIAKARSTAKAGDVFGDLAPYLRRILDEDWKARGPADRKALFDEIPPGLALAVNQSYPTTIPLASAPARLLAQLPVLPDVLEYRLVNRRRLLLRDRDANLIVDVLVAVRPTGPR